MPSDDYKPPANPWILKLRREGEARRKARAADIAKARAKQKPRHKEATDRTRARAAVRVAIKRGQLRPLACEYENPAGERCKRTPTEAHHFSFTPDQWLNVIWLCKGHHTPVTARQARDAAQLRRRKQARKQAAQEAQEAQESPGVIVIEPVNDNAPARQSGKRSRRKPGA